jgi:hypothetical protein
MKLHRISANSALICYRLLHPQKKRFMKPSVKQQIFQHQQSAGAGFCRQACWIKKMLLPLLLLLVYTDGYSQNQNLHYAINRNGKKVGDLSFLRTQDGNRTTYNIHSQVKVSVIISINVKARENSVYENDVMQSSSVVRHVNGKEKANKQIVKTTNGLKVKEGSSEKELKNYSVKFNTHCLYITEPVHYTNVFSDNYQRFVPIVKVADRHYKLTFPDGNSNEYFYENGICKKVKVKSQLFDAEFVLVSL